MSKHVQKLIEVALAEEGYLEKKSIDQLDDKTANAGRANFTKYARDLDNIPNFYNTKKQGVAWCDQFNDWCFVKAFGVEKAKELLGQPDKSFGAGCEYSANYYKKMGRFHTKNPQPGDQIFFWNEKKTKAGHTGIVVEVEPEHVYTIEGNTSGASGVIPNGGGVCRKGYFIFHDRIYGYGRPDYDKVLGEASKQPVKPKEEDIVNVELKTLKKGSEGEQVETLQRLLSTYGYNLGSRNPFDGKFGDKTVEAVKAYQKANGLYVDGIVGAKTWNKLLKG